MNSDILPRHTATASLAFELSFLESDRNRPAGEAGVFCAAIKVGDFATDELFWRKTVSVDALITTGDDSVKIGAKDEGLIL